MARERRRPTPTPRRAEFGRALLAARMHAGHTAGTAFARLLGWHQTKLSRVETGDQLPTAAEVDAYAAAAGVDAEPLHEAYVAATTSVLSASGRSGGVLIDHQRELLELELASSLVAEYQPLLVPGLAQTADYAREWLTQPGRPTAARSVDVEGIVAQRLDRQRQVLGGGRRVVVAVNEAALHAVYGTVEVQRAQLAHLTELAEAGTIELLVEPRAATLAVMRGFELLDEAVTLEDVLGLRVLSAPETVDAYRRALMAVRPRALIAGDAVGAVRRVRESL